MRHDVHRYDSMLGYRYWCSVYRLVDRPFGLQSASRNCYGPQGKCDVDICSRNQYMPPEVSAIPIQRIRLTMLGATF